MKVIWQLIGLLLIPVMAVAQSVLVLDTTFNDSRVEKPYLYQLKEPTRQLSLPADLPTDIREWQSVESINYGRRYFMGWAWFSVRSEQARTVWLELTTHFMDSVQVWSSSQDTGLQRIKGPSSYREQATPLSPVNHHYFLYALNLPARQTTTIWVGSRVVPGDALKFGLQLWSPRRFLAAQQQDIVGWATFVGIILAILGGVLIGFMFYRRSIYLFYACYVICLSVYSLLNDGWGAFLPDSLAWFDNISSIVHWLNLGFGAFVMFSRQFLTVSAYPARSLKQWPEFIPMLIIAGAVFLADWAQQTGSELIVKTAYFIGYLGFMGYGIIWLTYLVDAFRRKMTLAWLLILAVSSVLAFFSINSFLINFGLIGTPLPDMVALRVALLLEFTILSIAWFYRRKLLHTARLQLEVQNRQLQADVIQTQESERQRIAADLHDDLGGTLATIRRKIGDARQRFQHTAARETFDELDPLIQKSSDDLRRIAHHLMPPEFSRLGLCSALEQFVLSIPNQPTHFEFLVTGNERKLPVDLELNVYRIVSELIQNILKHAKAKRASVQLLYYGDRLCVVIEDDGVGFVAKKGKKSAGIGLINSNLRATYIGATLRRETGEGGTMILLELPYSSSHARTDSSSDSSD
ncbi:7TM diverse intracellular signaling domain-containing protein [Spirosoma sp. KNUC1025]|uniref:7TM diverse intracellular signaling domain-containing protein n=1 Tax=Spirosoma sp. KNUC1025 TaxID=2894082 RepID=UPI0038677BD0|nr:histidine kinase [Spirosoma sp. KNUC1025]